jgi:carboxyl-terminal processing protease
MLKRLLSSVLLLGILSSLPAGPITLSKRDRDTLKKETVYAIDLIQRYHYKQKKFSEIDPAILLETYYEDLDGSKSFFLQEDITFLDNRFSGTLKPSYLYIGDLYPAFEIFNVYFDRVNERLDWVEARLKEPFALDTEMTYTRDRSEAEWPATAEEADLLWEKRLTNELILELLEDETMDRAIETIARRYTRLRKIVDEIEVHNVQETFLTSLARLYDPHSNYFSWDSAREFDIQISNALVGIGAQLRDVDGYCIIERLLPGGPAEMSGLLHPGDKIVAVAQGNAEPMDVVGLKLRKIVQQIRGEAGSEVRLTILPAHSTKRKVVTLIREKVQLTANLASADLFDLPDGTGKTTRIGVIDLPSFYGEGSFGEGRMSTSGDVEELIGKLKEAGAESLVLDLRSNGGGRLDEAVKLTGLFISKGPVVMKRSFDGEVESDWDRNEQVAWEGPLVVLVSRSSASASEIVAGALQSYGRAVVVGDESTHGKGTVQAPIDLRSTMRRLPSSSPLEVGTVKITVQQFFLPNGDSTQNRGVVSDVSLPSANMFLLDGEADLDHALEWDSIPALEYKLPEREDPNVAIVSNQVLSGIRDNSLKRVEALEEFTFLKDNVEWYRKRHDRKEVSLNLEIRLEEKAQLEADRDIWEAERNRLSRKLAWPVTSVDLTLTEEKESAHQAKLASTPLPNGLPRANQFYQKVFYYQADESAEIKEIWVEFFDYEKALEDVDGFATLMSQSTATEISAEAMEAVLTRFKNIDRGSEFDVLAPFREVLGEDLQAEAFLAAMPAFFKRMVEVDPDILLERSKLDIPLREGLRVARDWALMERGESVPAIAARFDPTKDPVEKESL